MENKTSKTTKPRPLNKHDVGRSAVRCFECSETKWLKEDPIQKETYWCRKHYPERHAIISDYIRHAMFGT
jgi:hypothetical protein